MTKEQFENMIAYEGAQGDIMICAIDKEHIKKAKKVAEKLYRIACEDDTIIIDDWEDVTSCCFYTNFPTIQDLEDCDMLESIENKGFHINID